MADTGSTDRCRESRGQNIASCILISVVLCLAAWTSPIASVEGQMLNDAPTSGTSFAAGIEAVDLEQLPSVPDALVSEERQEHVPSSVRDHSSEAVVADHSSDVQILDYDHLVFANESSGELGDVVATTVSHLGVETSKLNTSFVPVAASFLLSIESPRESSLALHLSGVVLKVGDLLSGRKSSQGADAEIDADGSLEPGQMLDGVVLAEQGYVPTLGAIETYRDARRLGTCWKWTAPSDVQRNVHLGQGQLAAGETKPAASKLGRASRVLSLETRVLRPFCEEVGVSSLQVAQSLLDRNARNLVEERELGLLLPSRESGTLGCVPDGLLAQSPSFRALVQGSIVDESAAPDSPTKQDLLLGGRVEAVLESS
jgi:hypothetical protein